MTTNGFSRHDFFINRVFLGSYVGVSSFLISVLGAGFISAIAFWNGALNEIDAKIILFCFTVGAVMAVIQSIYVIGSVTFASLWSITTAVCWVFFYVVF